MSEPGNKEWLVVLEDDGREAALKRIRSQAVVDHVPSPRLLVIRAPERLAGIIQVEGVLGIYERRVPDEVLTSLDEGERLFALGWSARQTRGPKKRPGEGLSWNAEGFEPPDPPPERKPKDS